MFHREGAGSRRSRAWSEQPGQRSSSRVKGGPAVLRCLRPSVCQAGPGEVAAARGPVQACLLLRPATRPSGPAQVTRSTRPQEKNPLADHANVQHTNCRLQAINVISKCFVPSYSKSYTLIG
ncbi:hypothetical protein SEVIR_8G244900v4 [Setaria viridis]